MSSSPPQSNSPPSPPSLVSSERLEISIEGQYVLSQLEHIASLGRVSSKRKCVSIPFNEEPQVKKTVPTSTASSALATLVKTEELFQSAAPDRNALPVLLKLQSPILAKVQEIPKLEYDLHILRSMRIADYKQAVYIDPMAKLSLQDTDDNLFSLMDKVRNFIAGDTQVMLVLGDSGAGKSTFNRHLEHQLWQEYKPGGRIPLFINLPSLERPKNNLIAEQLRTHNFLEDQIRELKLYRQFTVICDGYDESQLASNLHTTNLLNRSGQWDVKLLVTCRSQYLGPDYRGRFVPLAVNQYNRAADDLFTEAVIAPFSKGQIEDYVERYVPLEPRTWVKKDYMDKLEAIPNLIDLVKNPFLLTLCLEALPDFVRGKSDLSRIRVTRVQLYDNFVRHWLEVNKLRLQENNLSGNKLAAFEELLEAGFEQSGVKFQQELATAIFVHKDRRLVVDYINIHDELSWKAAFFSTACKTSLLRDSSLLSRAGTQYRFVHRSILEYFFSRTICGPTGAFSDTSATLATISSHPLSQRDLVVEPSVIHFLAERVQLDSGFKDELLAIIELSKAHEKAARAAANAITILVKAGVRFNGADLRGIRVPGADMSGGQFDSAQFQEADLTGVNFTKSWIRQADFTKAQMKGVQFEEKPGVKEDDWVCSCAYSPEGTSFAVGLKDGRINIYDTSRWKMTRTYGGHQGRINGIAYSPTGHQLLSGSSDSTVQLWDCKSGSCVFVLEGHTDGVLAVAFSPCGMQVASAGMDKTVRLWDIQTRSKPSILTGHAGWIYSISYSPDGRTIVSVGDDRMIRFFDTQTGQPGDVWVSQSEAMRRVAYSPKGLEIAVGYSNGELLLYNTTTGKPMRSWEAHGEGVAGVSFSPKSQWVATCGFEGIVKVWSTVTGSVLSVFTGHSSSVYQVAISPSGLQLASCSHDKTIRLWDVSSLGTGMDVESRSDPLTSVLFSPDGRVLFCGSKSGTVRQYDVVSGEAGPFVVRGDSLVRCLAISPDGCRIASAGTVNKVVTVWDIGAGRTEFILSDHTGEVNAITFSADGRQIATGSDDKTVRLWDACSGKLKYVLEGHTYFVSSLAFSSDGLRILSGSGNGAVRAWDLDSHECRVVVDAGGLTEGWTISASSDGLKTASKPLMSYYVELWDMESGYRQQTLEHDEEPWCLAFSSCGQWMGVGLPRSVWLWNFVSDKTAEGGSRRKWRCLVRIRDIYGDVIGITWKPDALQFTIGCANGSLQMWKLVETSTSSSDEWSAQLVWSNGNPVLAASNAVFAKAIGLTPADQHFLSQRCKGAVVLTEIHNAMSFV